MGTAVDVCIVEHEIYELSFLSEQIIAFGPTKLTALAVMMNKTEHSHEAWCGVEQRRIPCPF